MAVEPIASDRTQVLLQTGRLKIARTLPHAELLARELVNFRSRVTAQAAESQLYWRERANDDLVLALAIAAWRAERNPCLGFSVRLRGIGVRWVERVLTVFSARRLSPQRASFCASAMAASASFAARSFLTCAR